MNAALPETATRLGWAGLLPFLAAPPAIVLGGAHGNQVGLVVAAYALAILCFLVGAWWGIALLRRRPVILVASNLVVILACVGFALLTTPAVMVLLALLLLATLGLERTHPMFSPQPAYYAALRLRLSVVASLCLLLSAVLL